MDAVSVAKAGNLEALLPAAEAKISLHLETIVDKADLHRVDLQGADSSASPDSDPTSPRWKRQGRNRTTRLEPY